jgi:2-dehydropantoate 2-reductase
MAAPSIAILGPGGVGGLLAAVLARAGVDVTVVARESTAERIADEGIHVESELLGDFTARPTAVARLARQVDVLIVAPKAAALEDALDRVDPTRSDLAALVVPLLNGFDHMALLRERLAAPVAAGTIRVQADRPAAGHVVQRGRFLLVELASDDAALRPRLDELAGALNDAGALTRVRERETQILWAKLVRLNSLACMTAAHDVTFGAIREDSARWAQLEACVREGAAVARAEGAEIDPEVVFGEFEALHAGFGTSMQRDVAAGREPELDAIAGAVLRAGERHGIPCPTVAALAAQIAERAGVPVPAGGAR